MKHLTRDEFRTQVFERDHHKCVMCGAPGQDAHHIMERRLFPIWNGGYYLDNGATLCGDCHLKAEATTISVDDIRNKLRGQGHAPARILPPQLYADESYDKWGNIILSSGLRLAGELIDDESVRKAMASSLHLITSRVKYPRTFHLPFSPSRTAENERTIHSLQSFKGKEVVITEKMDGENTTMYRDYIHARSMDYTPHPSRDYVKSIWGNISHDIPNNYRICGENLYAKHSIHYQNLSSYFQVFGVWDRLICLSWRETAEWANLLGLDTVKVLYIGVWNENIVKTLAENELHEGIVVRVAKEMHIREWKHSCAKWVRANHVQTHGHWMRQQVVPNLLEEK